MYSSVSLHITKTKSQIDHEVLSRLDGYDPERGVKVVGHRGYFLKKWGVFLNQYDLPVLILCHLPANG